MKKKNGYWGDWGLNKEIQGSYCRFLSPGGDFGIEMEGKWSKMSGFIASSHPPATCHCHPATATASHSQHKSKSISLNTAPIRPI
jgi:hypothetical protein